MKECELQYLLLRFEDLEKLPKSEREVQQQLASMKNHHVLTCFKSGQEGAGNFFN